MKRLGWPIRVAVLLVALSAVLYVLHWRIFHDADYVGKYILAEIAFLPISVLIVALILHRILQVHEKRALRHKLNMVIGAFYSEVGGDLLRALSEFDTGVDALRAQLAGAGGWEGPEFAETAKRLRVALYAMDARRGDLAALRSRLVAKREFLLRLLENPNLLEHGSFTDLLWAVFHLTEELSLRKDLAALPDSDLDHLGGDLKRAYALLVAEWLLYVRHLKHDYPYLFSLAIRTNPFNPGAKVEVK
jgi:hypothetical protein